MLILLGDLRNKLKRDRLSISNTKGIGNSINHRDYRLDNDYITHHDEDTIR